MSRFYFALLSTASLILSSCDSRPNPAALSDSGFETALENQTLSQDARDIVSKNCVNDWFAQGHSDHLYGLVCIEGKRLLIETSDGGEPAISSKVAAQDRAKGLILEEELDFINKFYKTKYTILKDEADDKNIPFLRRLLPENEPFSGFLNTKYHIVFETRGNYLVLFKASKDPNDLPYTERTSLTKSKKGDLYMVPFIGYPIRYCRPENIKNEQNQETYRHRCQEALPESAKYIELKSMDKRVYQYMEKKDLLPASYFEGRWFFADGPIEDYKREGHLAVAPARFVEMRKKSSALEFISASENVEERNKSLIARLPVQWVEYEMDKDGEVFKGFGERTVEGAHGSVNSSRLIVDWERAEGEIVEMLVTNSYFSFISEKPITILNDEGEPQTTKIAKYRTSFLREEALDTEGFVPRKWFKDDHDHIFGIIYVAPQDERKEGEYTEEETYDHLRMIRFNTHLGSEREKEEKTKIIKFHFSDNSTPDRFYRDIAKRAVEIYNRAFEIITEDSDQKIKIELAEDEGDKALGDMRYNTINLIKTEDMSAFREGEGILFGAARPYVRADTGQMIGTTVNIVIQNILEQYNQLVGDYIRYEIFQKDKHRAEEDAVHAVSPYFIAQIESLCVEEITNLIRARHRAKPRDNLNDKTVILECGKKIAGDYILHNIMHEMGHAFALGHNFKASIDQDNYWRSAEEIEQYFPQAFAARKRDGEIAKLSSVMDYIPFTSVPSLPVLGKYDLAALRFLYRDQVETKGGNWLDLRLPSNPSKQKPLYSDRGERSVFSQMKRYLHCSDFVAMSPSQDFLCLRRDYGSNPKEIVEFYIEKASQAINFSRYRYDRSNFLGAGSILPSIFNALSFYKKWTYFRDIYLSSSNNLPVKRYQINNPASVDSYINAIDIENKNEEYKSYYGLREPFHSFFLDLLFIEPMKCQVKDSAGGDIHRLDLEFIKTSLFEVYKDELYVEDCYSEMVMSFLEDNDLTLAGQTGMENFTSYYPYLQGEEADRLDVLPFALFVKPIYGLFMEKAQLDEPDLFYEFGEKLKTKLLNSDGASIADFQSAINLYLIFTKDIKRQLQGDSNRDMLEENLSWLRSMAYQMGTGSASFYKVVLDPLQRGRDIEDINVPYLTAIYREWKETANSESVDQYEAYLIQQPDIIYDKTKYLIVPYKKDSFAADLIKKYNENIKEIKRLDDLEKQQELSFLQRSQRESLKLHNDALFKSINLN